MAPRISNIYLDNQIQNDRKPNVKRIIAGVLIFLLLQGLAIMGLFHRPDLALYDYLFRIRGVQEPGHDVIIVAIDDASLKKLGSPPLPRGMYAQLLSRLKTASAVAFNMNFDSSRDERQDELFSAAIKKHGKVALSCVITFEGEGAAAKERIRLPVLPLLKSAANIGFLNIPTDDDSLVRRTTLVDVNFSRDVPVPSLALATLLTARHEPDWQVKNHVLNIAGHKIYMDQNNRALFNYWGPAGTIPKVSFLDVINGNIPSQSFANKIVLVAYTSSADHDVFLIPCKPPAVTGRGGEMTGVEIQASIIQSLLDNRMYREMPPLFQAGFLLLVMIAGFLLASRCQPLQRVVLIPVMVLIVAAVIFGMWWYGWVFYPVAPLIGVVLSLVVSGK